MKSVHKFIRLLVGGIAVNCLLIRTCTWKNFNHLNIVNSSQAMGTVWGVYLLYTVALHESKIPILAMNTIVSISLPRFYVALIYSTSRLKYLPWFYPMTFSYWQRPKQSVTSLILCTIYYWEQIPIWKEGQKGGRPIAIDPL